MSETDSKKRTLKGKYPLDSPQQEMYCQEYLIDLNQKQAAIRAGYSPRSAHSTASRLMTYVKVQERIQYLKMLRVDRLEEKGDQIIKRLFEAFKFNIFDIIEVSTGEETRYEGKGRDRKAYTIEVQRLRLKEVPKDISWNIQSISETNGGGLRLVSLDKIKIAELLGRALGFTKEGREDEGPMNPEELQQLLHEVFEDEGEGNTKK